MSSRTTFPLLPLRNGVIFPGTTVTLPLGRERSVALARAVRPGDILVVVTQKDGSVTEPTEDGLYHYGTFARVQQIARAGDREYRMTVEGLGRFEMAHLVSTDPYWTAEGSIVEEPVSNVEEARLLAKVLRERVEELAGRSGGAASSVRASEDQPGLVADQIAAGLGLATDKEMEVLQTIDVIDRLRQVAALVNEVSTLSEMRRKIEGDVRKEIGKTQRDVLLREQMRAIQRELGDDKEDDLSRLREKLDKAGLPDEARSVADRELKRLEGMSPQSPESNVARTYLETLAELPWNTRAEAKDDIDAIKAKLDADHHGLEEVKKRILEHMAVLKVSKNPRGTILCLAGPPGVGKTSLGQSIADATGRPFVRISLGGVRDEAEVRGHRRTYVGALPGRIVHALRKAKVKNPVFLLDEIDKLGTGWQGSPEAALLEVLDPEQNKTFTDHYLEVPFDLSEVIFIATANTLETLSAPLRDRLEILELAGYTPDEKTHIAQSHLIPKALRDHGLDEGSLNLTEPALSAVITDYTREAGVRQLTRQITKLVRALALEVARATDGKPHKLTVDTPDLATHLGKRRFFSEVAERTQVPGVATGLAWTPVGGDILFIETSRMPGKGMLEITGQLGDVMKESARAALTYVRSNATALGVDPRFLEGQDVHVHVPAGGVPKDGPSAGVTIFTALTSLLSGRKVRSDTAMTGEVTLRGRVLPVGGIKAKVLAAHRAGLTRVILPEKNARDLDEVPEEVRRHLEIGFASDMSEVLAFALEPADTAQGIDLSALPMDIPLTTSGKAGAGGGAGAGS
ncbi:endopeptidase La [Pendulispora albinea]|uniref:Lon protease n=1 Tax=Pendulispora albinea TaxID=2741071 RepID=A0ABZ2LTA3_9BACT